MKTIKKLVTAVILTVSCFSLQAERLYSVKTSGILFKDTLNVDVFDDPSIDGISCYINLPEKSLSWDDQTDSSLSCRKVGDIKGELSDEKNIFSQSKNPFFKHVQVDRIYDHERDVLVYISYTKKLTGNNASSSISVVVVD